MIDMIDIRAKTMIYLPTTIPTTQIKNLWHTMSVPDTLFTSRLQS